MKMKNICEFLSTKVDKQQLDNLVTYASELPILQSIIDKYDFKFRVLKTGNVELISEKASFNWHKGLRFVFYIINPKKVLRRQYSHRGFNSIGGWSNPPSNMGEFDSVDEMCEYFNSWANKKLSL